MSFSLLLGGVVVAAWGAVQAADWPSEQARPQRPFLSTRSSSSKSDLGAAADGSESDTHEAGPAGSSGVPVDAVPSLDDSRSAYPGRRHEPPVGPRVRELFAQGVELLKNNRPFDARSYFEQAANLAPHSAGIHCNLGLAYQNSGNIPKAISEFRISLGLTPRMPEATLNLAGCYQSAGNRAEAIKWYRAYLEENPNSSQIKQVRGIIEELTKASRKASSDPKGPDYFKNVIAEGVFRWPPERMPLRVFIDGAVKDGKLVRGYKPSFRDSLVKAFSDWCDATGGRLTYRIVSDRQAADIYCAFTADPAEVAGDGREGERGAAKLTARSGLIQSATLKILTRPILSEGTLSDDDMTKACLHEVGHVLGLQGHSANNHDVMFYTVDTATVWPVLSRRDKRTIARLYEKYPQLPSAKVSGGSRSVGR